MKTPFDPTTASQEELAVQRLADISTGLARDEPQGGNSTIGDLLRKIGEALQLKGAAVWCSESAKSQPVLTHSWVRAEGDDPRLIVPSPSMAWVRRKLEAGQGACFADPVELPDSVDRDVVREAGLAAGAVFPLPAARSDSQSPRAIGFSAGAAGQGWTPGLLNLLPVAAGVIGQAVAKLEINGDLRSALDEVRRLRGRATATVPIARPPRETARATASIVSESRAVQRALALAEQVAPTPATVLLLGETGSGKEVFAQAIHDLSPRHQREMVRVNCAAIPHALLESELFGREAGAYTGSFTRQAGRFEAANDSTLFLDEIGELPLDMQVKLLRALQERTIQRLGGTQPIKLNVRIIAATNRKLEEAVDQGQFREDLFYRLNVFPVTVPPLRERVEDIAGLVWAFVDEFSKSFGKNVQDVSPNSIRELQRYAWPGNVRELRNTIERAVILATGTRLDIAVPEGSPSVGDKDALVDVQMEHIMSVLDSTYWRVRGRGGAAERLGLKPTTLESRMAKLGICRDDGFRDVHRRTANRIPA
jgi:formate hydrogenlyase transcriptional activator